MTLITYYACRIKKYSHGIPIYGFLWREIVTGDVEERKKEIIKEHEKLIIDKNKKPIFYNDFQVDDYLDFQI